MSVTAEQWAQAEAERLRQAEMVQTLINEVRRLGTEQNNNLVTRNTHTNLDVKQEKRIDDYWNIDGSRDLFDLWTGFT